MFGPLCVTNSTRALAGSLSSCCWIVAEKLAGCIDENVQRFAGDCGRNQSKEDYRPKQSGHRYQTSVGRRANTGLLEPYPFLNRGVTADEGGGGENAWISGPKHP